MMLFRGWLTILCPVLILFIILSFHSTISSGDEHRSSDNEVLEDEAELSSGFSESKSELLDTNNSADDEGESRAGFPHKIRRIIRRRRRRKKPKNPVRFPAPKYPAASPKANDSTSTTTAKPPISNPEAQRETTRPSTTTKRPLQSRLTTTRKVSSSTTPAPIKTTTTDPSKTADKTAVTTTSTTTAPKTVPNGTAAPLHPQSTTKKPLESKDDAEQTVVKTTTTDGTVQLVSVEKAPIKRPNEIKPNATVTADMPILSINATTTTTAKPVAGQQVPVSSPSKSPGTPQATREQINKALDIPGVKCGQVPLYENLYGRSINETKESAGQVRILHGLDSVAGEWPWIARITECKGTKCGTCTGTLLNHRWLITAGHCGFGKRDLSKFKVTFGLYDLVTPDESSFTLDIDKIIVHPDYKDLNNDLTLMRLAQPVKFGPNIQPACLLGPTRNVLGKVAKKPAYNVGYGMTEGMSEAIKLQKLRVKAKAPSECNSDTLGSVRLKPNTVCMGVPDGKIGGSCKGDSGGPNLYYEPASNQWVLFATVSYGPTVCDREDGEQWLTVSVDLSNYRSWILKTILVES